MDTFARFAEVDAAFDAALALAPDERAGHLGMLRETDAWIAERVEALLEAAGQGDSFMAEGGAWAGPFGAALSTRLGADEPTPPAAVGSYRIIRTIGRGGMSVVYLAHRANADFEHDVAVKILKRGLDTEDVLGRFAQERQILASLNHPGIAQLFDGGATEDGLPYIVMEYVEGVPIDRYCAERRLAVTERLRLFLDVARAVQHAHRHLIVHRDLKPGNVLVTEEGHVKLLDFGIAKLLDDAHAGSVPSTRPAARLMTPEYASPEQRRGEPITTACDVYQLGLMLYELLAGRRAFDGLAATDVLEPLPPSAAARITASDHAIDRELDCVVRMALRPEPRDRYASVEQFAEDVERYLSSTPLLARPTTLSYRLRKFARRHRGGVTMAAAFLLATIAYATTLALQAREIVAQRDRAQVSAATAGQVARFMIDVFTLANPTEGEGTSVTARQLLDRGASRLETDLADQPETLAEMLRATGTSYFGLGLNSQAEPLLRRSVELLRPLPSGAAALVTSLTELGRLMHEQGRGADAERFLNEALALGRRVHEAEHPAIATTLHHLGRVRAAGGDHAAAERLFTEALAIRERLLGHEHADVAQSLHGLGVTRQAAGNLAGAEPPIREALRIREATRGAAHPDTTDSLNALGLLLRDRGNATAAEPLLRRALEANRTRLGARHPYVATNMNNLALILRDQGRAALAEPLYRDALDILRDTYGHEHPRVAIALFNLAAVLLDIEKYAQAEPLYREALEIDRKALGDDHLEVAVDRTHLGRLLHLKGETTAAEALLRQALTRLRSAVAPNHPRLAQAAYRLGHLLVDTNRAGEAEPLLQEAASIDREQFGADDPRTLAVLLTLGRATTMLGHFGEMQAVVSARCRELPGRYRIEVARALDDFLRTFERVKGADASGEVRSRAVCNAQRTPG